ncbi:hypothetical protein [Celerinatantimonas sp. YJH-8]|uniref:hypothetical protein n=1 Tax=Celerinatantimonas sp. YJH-8 TaxID=3228714 RepID=UPI0038C5124A
MTAEIAVFNKSGVSLAADSAVTVTSGIKQKIYNGAEKLFALTKYHPVGIMVYGTGSLCHVPWELIVKTYRKRLGNKSFSTLDGYAEDFWTFLCESDTLIPRDLRRDSLSGTFVQSAIHIANLLERECSSYADINGSLPDTITSLQILEECCENVISELAVSDYFNGFDSSSIDELKATAKPFADEILPNVFNITLSDNLKQKFCDVFAYIACKQNNLGVNTGVVFAGYGEDEYFPVILTYKVQGYIEDKLRYAPIPEKSAAAGLSGIVAYAQEEEVVTFLNGVNPILKNRIENIYKEATNLHLDSVKKLIDELSQTEDEALKMRVVDCLNSVWDDANQKINVAIRDEHTDKVIRMIEFLSKEDLAYMAESLVNITAFKRKVSNDSETVGGPIDVAIISKGDGFIWSKRKHYFSQDLNHHYFNTFLKGKYDD